MQLHLTMKLYIQLHHIRDPRQDINNESTMMGIPKHLKPKVGLHHTIAQSHLKQRAAKLQMSRPPRSILSMCRHTREVVSNITKITLFLNSGAQEAAMVIIVHRMKLHIMETEPLTIVRAMNIRPKVATMVVEGEQTLTTTMMTATTRKWIPTPSQHSPQSKHQSRNLIQSRRMRKRTRLMKILRRSL